MKCWFRKAALGVCVVAGAAGLLASATGCDDRGDTPPAQSQATSHADTTPAEALPAGLVLTEAPAGAKDVAALRQSAKEGEEVVLRGRVGGSASPFVDGRASFQVVDVSVRSCKEIPGDTCETPWDYCCEEPKEVAAHSASVQVVGTDGKPLRSGLSGVGGLKPLSEVTVRGMVAKAGASGPLVINATGIHVKG